MILMQDCCLSQPAHHQISNTCNHLFSKRNLASSATTDWKLGCPRRNFSQVDVGFYTPIVESNFLDRGGPALPDETSSRLVRAIYNLDPFPDFYADRDPGSFFQ